MLDSSNKIAGTVKNIHRWKEDLFICLKKLRDEIDLLLLSKKKIQRAQTALGIVCSITTECLARRAFRLNKDLTLDSGQVELIKVRLYSRHFNINSIMCSRPLSVHIVRRKKN